MRNGSPLYRQIANQMKEEITTERWTKGETIPTEAKLSELFNASRVTIRQAIKLLVQEGLLYKIQGSGTYVSENKFEHNIYSLKGFTEEMHALNKTTKNKILTFSIIEPDERIQTILGLGVEEKVFFVRRQRWVENTPLVVEDTYLPLKLFPDLSYKTMEGSKYDYIEREKGMKIKESFQEVIPLLPDREIQSLLQLTEAIPIIKVQLFSHLMDDTTFEYTEIYFKSDEYKFTIVASRHS
ncbi:transcriptional regulator [Salipaludibacillus keqinensis]|uniref:Transcriptional regulator n=1 Tax=Salipaludibacillus keqinensis TaxID=2045207 RepID=A0A323TFM9_9BACI|nr:UTRA domain-containing protein [Salipaludibacillus keqinensis]PYZ94002.1 transcriptional regulator [Salipaludibacillus keqinensis]